MPRLPLVYNHYHTFGMVMKIIIITPFIQCFPCSPIFWAQLDS